MFKTMGWPEIILLLVIVLLVFGVGRIGKIAGELGEGIRAFKEGLSGKKDQPSEEENKETEE
jgi:sec-independent protein translocase protein TatA